MNKITFRHSGYNNDESVEFFTAANQEQTEIQIMEVLIQKHYQMGKVKKDMTIIDCGANIGLASIFFEDYAEIIYALEPSSKNYECLIKNIETHEKIKPFQLGLASRTNFEWLRTNDNSPIAESLFGNGPEIELVKLLSIEDFMNEQKIDHVDLLKMDAEGAEYIIFPSKAFMNVADKIDYIVGECHYFGTLIPEYIPLILEERGFDMKFLPINNMFLVLHWKEEGNERQYRVEKETIFFAKRKELPWPS